MREGIIKVSGKMSYSQKVQRSSEAKWHIQGSLRKQPCEREKDKEQAEEEASPAMVTQWLRVDL